MTKIDPITIHVVPPVLTIIGLTWFFSGSILAGLICIWFACLGYSFNESLAYPLQAMSKIAFFSCFITIPGIILTNPAA